MGQRRKPAPARRARLPVAVVGITTAVALVSGHPWHALTLAAAGAVLGAVSARWPEVPRWLDARVRDVANGLGHLVSAFLHVVAIMPTWAVRTVAGVEPIHRPPGWIHATAASDAGHVDAATPASRAFVLTRSARRTTVWRPLAVLATTGALVVAIVALGRPTDRSAPRAVEPAPGFTFRPFAHEGEPWARKLFGEFLSNQQVAWDPVVGWVASEVGGTYLNVHDGERRSYVPSAPTLTVWFFGGSTAYGLGQRDLHTIPSELARLSERSGIRIRVQNFGVPGYANWQEVQLFLQLLGTRPAPDLAVFYDGVNEVAIADQRSDLRDGDPEAIRRQLVSEYERRKMAERLDADPRRPALTGDDATALQAEQYSRGIELAAATGRAHDVRTAFVWQPGLLTKRLTENDRGALDLYGMDVPDVPPRPDPMLAIVRTRHPDVIDLTHALDDADRPVLHDYCHTNEHGAAMIAARLFESLRPVLAELDDPARGAQR